MLPLPAVGPLVTVPLVTVMPLLVKFNTGSLKVAVKLTGEVEVELPLASLTAGRTFPITAVPPGVSERYMRIFYDITGTAPTLGKVTAGIVASVQTSGVTL